MADYALAIMQHRSHFCIRYTLKFTSACMPVEIAPGLVPYEGLCCHIRLAIEQAVLPNASATSVDVMYEELSARIAERNGCQACHGRNQPQQQRSDPRRFREGTFLSRFTGNSAFPVSLNTDDEGVSRIDLTHEYVRAVQTYDLHYTDLKQMVRTGLEHIFLAGDKRLGGTRQIYCNGPSLLTRSNRHGKNRPHPARLFSSPAKRRN